MNTERNLLAGILALQLKFIDRRQLLGAFERWISDKSKALTGILESSGQLTTERRMLLEALVEEHLKVHGGDPQKSLAELTPIGPLREELAALADRDLEASLAHLSVSRGVDASGTGIQDLFRQARVRDPASLPSDDDPFRTAPWPAGERAPSPSDDDPIRTVPRSAVESTTDFRGSAFCGPMRVAGWAKSTSRAMKSCTATWP